jgi:hypothetical protein
MLALGRKGHPIHHLDLLPHFRLHILLDLQDLLELLRHFLHLH